MANNSMQCGMCGSRWEDRTLKVCPVCMTPAEEGAQGATEAQEGPAESPYASVPPQTAVRAPTGRVRSLALPRMDRPTRQGMPVAQEPDLPIGAEPTPVRHPSLHTPGTAAPSATSTRPGSGPRPPSRPITAPGPGSADENERSRRPLTQAPAPQPPVANKRGSTQMGWNPTRATPTTNPNPGIRWPLTVNDGGYRPPLKPRRSRDEGPPITEKNPTVPAQMEAEEELRGSPRDTLRDRDRRPKRVTDELGAMSPSPELVAPVARKPITQDMHYSDKELARDPDTTAEDLDGSDELEFGDGFGEKTDPEVRIPEHLITTAHQAAHAAAKAAEVAVAAAAVVNAQAAGKPDEVSDTPTFRDISIPAGALEAAAEARALAEAATKAKIQLEERKRLAKLVTTTAEAEPDDADDRAKDATVEQQTKAAEDVPAATPAEAEDSPSGGEPARGARFSDPPPRSKGSGPMVAVGAALVGIVGLTWLTVGGGDKVDTNGGGQSVATSGANAGGVNGTTSGTGAVSGPKVVPIPGGTIDAQAGTPEDVGEAPQVPVAGADAAALTGAADVASDGPTAQAPDVQAAPETANDAVELTAKQRREAKKAEAKAAKLEAAKAKLEAERKAAAKKEAEKRAKAEAERAAAAAKAEAKRKADADKAAAKAAKAEAKRKAEIAEAEAQRLAEAEKAAKKAAKLEAERKAEALKAAAKLEAKRKAEAEKAAKAAKKAEAKRQRLAAKAAAEAAKKAAKAEAERKEKAEALAKAAAKAAKKAEKERLKKAAEAAKEAAKAKAKAEKARQEALERAAADAKAKAKAAAKAAKAKAKAEAKAAKAAAKAAKKAEAKRREAAERAAKAEKRAEVARREAVERAAKERKKLAEKARKAAEQETKRAAKVAKERAAKAAEAKAQAAAEAEKRRKKAEKAAKAEAEARAKRAAKAKKAAEKLAKAEAKRAAKAAKALAKANASKTPDEVKPVTDKPVAVKVPVTRPAGAQAFPVKYYDPNGGGLSDIYEALSKGQELDAFTAWIGGLIKVPGDPMFLTLRRCIRPEMRERGEKKGMTLCYEVFRFLDRAFERYFDADVEARKTAVMDAAMYLITHLVGHQLADRYDVGDREWTYDRLIGWAVVTAQPAGQPHPFETRIRRGAAILGRLAFDKKAKVSREQFWKAHAIHQGILRERLCIAHGRSPDPSLIGKFKLGEARAKDCAKDYQELDAKFRPKVGVALGQ